MFGLPDLKTVDKRNIGLERYFDIGVVGDRVYGCYDGDFDLFDGQVVQMLGGVVL